jgi:hypothetical protein
MLLSWWPLLGLPLPQDLATFRGQDGAGALAPVVTWIAFYIAQPLWILSAIGLCALRWWGRLLFIATYAMTMLASLVGGMNVLFPWESFLGTLAGLLDGAVLTLAFLPPLSRHFARESS